MYKESGNTLATVKLQIFESYMGPCVARTVFVALVEIWKNP